MQSTRNYNGKNWLYDTVKTVFMLFMLAFFTGCSQTTDNYSKWVNPFIGTGGHGHTYPGASAPFGMVQLSPDTRTEGWDACSGYHYSDSTIIGFSHTHLSGTGAADYGDILITPGYTNNTPLLHFDHQNEKAWAGYYEVETKEGIDVRLTTTPRTGIHQISFKEPGERFMAIDLEHGIGPDQRTSSFWEQTGENEISGFRHSMGWAKDQLVFFVARFSEDFTVDETSVDSTRAVLAFKTDQVMVKLGISAVSIDGAMANLESEARHWDFEQYLAQNEQAWNKELAKIEAEFQSDDDRTTFYTALYHSFLAPNIFSDVDGSYRGMDRQVHQSNSTHYTVFSLWDTFRATHPLFNLVNTQANIEMINTMLNMYEQGGLLPVWELAGNETGTMIGYHAIPVIADAIMKDIPGFDYNLALEAMIKSAVQDHLGLAFYKEMGFIPAEKEHESVSKTLEYAYDDWCIATVAKKLGEDSIYQVFSTRAQYYKNLYDVESGFMRPKRNSSWLVEFDPYEVSGNYTEANAWQYNYFVPHDLTGLNQLFGSVKGLEQRLDELFNAESKVTGRHQPDIDGMIGQYAHGNEPSHNFAYLYNWTENPWKSQELIARINRELYANAPDGLSGNEDCGQMSSWFVFSALGFYPAIPGSDEYVIGSPLTEKAVISMENGNRFSVRVHNLSAENVYIKAIKLNGANLDRYYLTHEEITTGGQLEFVMSDKPVSIAVSSMPNSSVESREITPVPVIQGGEMTFLNQKKISISSPDPTATIYYTFDNSQPDSTGMVFSKPFMIDSTLSVKAVSYAEGKLPSGTVSADFVKIPYGRKITLKYPYSHLYTGNSSMALIDYIHGGRNFRDGWQGFHEVDLDAVVDLGKIRRIDEVNVGFVQEHYSWIFYPKYLEVSFSNDGRSFSKPVRIENEVSEKEDGLINQRLGSRFSGKSARYVRILAKNMGKCPEWHKGAGGKAWLFADEIEIKTN
jgi:predicted alpha-1,2-mannosidase